MVFFLNGKKWFILERGEDGVFPSPSFFAESCCIPSEFNVVYPRHVLVMSYDMEKEENISARRSARRTSLPCRPIWEHRKKKGSSLSERLTAWANLPRHE
jgi:hypothetical protein